MNLEVRQLEQLLTVKQWKAVYLLVAVVSGVSRQFICCVCHTK